jgi:hypothetical protein
VRLQHGDDCPTISHLIEVVHLQTTTNRSTGQPYMTVFDKEEEDEGIESGQ